MIPPKTQRDIASFVLRFTQELWQDDQGEAHVQWRGHIRHVQGDEEMRFTDFAEAVAFIQRHLTQLTLGALEARSGRDRLDPEQTLRESVKFWEEFAAGYTGLVFEAMGRAIQQSEAFGKQMDAVVQQSLQAWPLPGRDDQAPVVEALTRLQAQVQALADKVARLENASPDADAR